MAARPWRFESSSGHQLNAFQLSKKFQESPIKKSKISKLAGLVDKRLTSDGSKAQRLENRRPICRISINQSHVVDISMFISINSAAYLFIASYLSINLSFFPYYNTRQQSSDIGSWNESYTEMSDLQTLKWSGKFGQHAKVYPTRTNGYENDEQTELFRQV